MMMRARILLFVFVLSLMGIGQTDSLSKANQLLNAKDYKGAEQAFREATQKDPANALAWLGLGQALQGQGEAQGALDAFGKITKPSPNIAAQVAFRQARAHAKLGQADSAFAALDRAVNSGFASQAVLEAAPEIKNLQNDPRYQKLLQTIDTKARPCMHDPRFRAFDFWVGEWEVRPTGQPSAPPGRSSIQKILEGCVVFENFTSNAGSYFGKSFNIFDTTTGRWYQRYVDSTGARLEWDGELRNNTMYYTGVNYNAAGQKVQDRLTFFKLETGHVRQLWEQSPDGKQWTVVFDGEYSPLK
jgi:tetratricopeptide (TPR) repeat protein